MRDLLRDAAVGQVLRFLTRGKVATYPEDAIDFKLPALQTQSNLSESGSATCDHQASNTITLVTWYTDNDPANPHNWSSPKKLWISFLILTYTLSVYIGSSLYTASESAIVSLYGVSEVVAALGLSLYVIGYGVGPMLFSPLSEIPAIGRNPPYVITYALFVVLCVPTSLVDNLSGLLVLRFLLGFFGSPCLATGGASYGDFYGGREMPYVIALWGGGATLAPALGPLVGGFAVQYENWRWSSWELLWFTGPVFILMFLALPETSSDKILLQRARRLRTLTGRTDLRASSEIRQEKMATGQIVFQALIKPWEINIKDPAMLFTTFYTALTYAIYYSFFESFPLVYQEIYGFNLSELGLAFLAVLVGLCVAVAAYCAYFYWISDPIFAKAEQEGHAIPPEARLRPGLVATFFIPAGLFIYAWTSRPSLHYLISLVGVAISMFGVFIISQCMFIYLPFTYPRYAGSLFAANGFARSVFAAGAILYARPMFLGMGVAGGVSLLGGLCAGCCAGIYAIFFFGERLRLSSRFAVT
ncbi:MFS general substrate transporter [Mytilinidion resinicola]|uniref:MFS general substrate transporter n=1 Tax=Mytilinidion resinicola TaxID=574789 RepID=A0A6A6XZX8_9PEZI|nr:MFS general substrate transporter [Mytilinidion resinicola]KAF2801525.1 MFS general substrate transporter [Mytilinidion resinicola]